MIAAPDGVTTRTRPAPHQEPAPQVEGDRPHHRSPDGAHELDDLRWTSCRRCSRPAFRKLGSVPLCERHRAEILDPILARVIADESRPGWGVPIRHRPDLLPWAYDLECVQCRAQWVDRAGAVCPWCARRLDGAREVTA